MLDDRFPPQPQLIDIPLYQHTSEQDIINCHSNIEDIICDEYNLKKTNILLASSATNALLYFLQTKFFSRKVIAFPAFFCPYVVYEFYKSGYEVIFFDFITAQDFNKDILEFLQLNKVSVIVLPSLFNKQNWDIEMINTILSREIVLIMDFAHTFPIEQPLPINDDNLITLFSFGKNKPLASSGGGGIYYHGSLPISSPKQNPKEKQSSINKYNVFYHRLGELLNSTLLPCKQKKYEYSRIDSKNATEILNNMKVFSSKHSTLHSEVSNRIKISLVLKKLFIPDQVFCILQLRSANRLHLGNVLSQYGIQTTWYYYPIPYISIFKNCPSTTIEKTLAVSTQILVLPFSIHHNPSDIHRMLDVLEEVAK